MHLDSIKDTQIGELFVRAVLPEAHKAEHQKGEIPIICLHGFPDTPYGFDFLIHRWFTVATFCIVKIQKK